MFEAIYTGAEAGAAKPPWDRLLTAAALAVVSNDPRAHELVAEVERMTGSFAPDDERLVRLRAAIR